MRMFRRGFTSLALAGTLLMAAAVPAAMAGTKDRFTYEVYFAEASSSLGLDSVDVVAQFGKSDGVSFRELAVNNWTFQSACQGDGNVTGTISVNTFGTSETAVITFDKDYLATATASGTLTVTDTIVNSCTGVETPGRTYTTAVSLDLHATTALTSTTTRTVTQEPDGTVAETLKNSQRDAAGSMSVGGTSYASDPTTIVHQTDRIVFTPTR